MSHSKQNLRKLAQRHAIFNTRRQMLLDEKRLNAQLVRPGNSEAHVAIKIKSILRLLGLVIEQRDPSDNVFESIHRSINTLKRLKKRVPNRPRSTSGTPRPHTNNRQQNALHS